MGFVQPVAQAFSDQFVALASDPELVQAALLAGGYGAYRKYRG